MKRLALLASLVLGAWGAWGACGKSEQAKPAPGVSASSSGAPPVTETIALPVATGDPIGTATTFLRYAGGKLVEIDKSSIFGDRSKPFHGVDASGTLTSAANGFTLAGAHDVFPMASPTAVFVDRATPAAEARAVIMAALRGHCWGFAVADLSTANLATADLGKLELLEPTPCPPAARSGDQVNLDLVITTAGKATAKPSSGEVAQLDTAEQLTAYLVAMKATPFFAGRTDLAMAFDDQATVGTVVAAIARAYAAGFVSAAWVTR